MRGTEDQENCRLQISSKSIQSEAGISMISPRIPKLFKRPTSDSNPPQPTQQTICNLPPPNLRTPTLSIVTLQRHWGSESGLY